MNQLNQLDYDIIGNKQPSTTLGDHIGQAMKIANDLETSRQQRETYKRKTAAYDKSVSDEEKVRRIFDSGFNEETGRVDLPKIAPQLFKVLPPDVAYSRLQEAMKYHDEMDVQERAAAAGQFTEQYLQAENLTQQYPNTVTERQAPNENIGLLAASADDPRAAAIIKAATLQLKFDPFGKTPTGLDLKYANDPEYVQAAAADVQSYYDNGLIDKDAFAALSGTVKLRPISYKNELMAFIKQKTDKPGKKLENIKTGEEIEKIRLEREAKEKENSDKTMALAGAQNERNTIISAIDDIYNSPSFATGLNPKRLIQSVPGTPDYDWTQKILNLKSKLALSERSKLKGQGQISDFEGKMLDRAVSMLNTNLSAKGFKQELDRLKDVINKMNAAVNKPKGIMKKVWNEQTRKFKVQ